MDVVTLKKAVKDAGKYTDQEVSALESLFADSRIVESGSNENGEYWRWENGWQECYLHLGNYTLDEAVPSGSIGVLERPFPVPFIAVPIMTVSGSPTSTDGTQRMAWLTPDPSASNFRVRIPNVDNAAVLQLRRLAYLARGRWKEE